MKRHRLFLFWLLTFTKRFENHSGLSSEGKTTDPVTRETPQN